MLVAKPMFMPRLRPTWLCQPLYSTTPTTMLYDYAPRLRQQTTFMVSCTHKKCRWDFESFDDTQKVTLSTLSISSAC